MITSNRIRGIRIFNLIPIPLRKIKLHFSYLSYLASFFCGPHPHPQTSSFSSTFKGMHPHSQGSFFSSFRGIHPHLQLSLFSAIFTSSFLIRLFSNYLIVKAKKIFYGLSESISFTLSRTTLSSFNNSFSYFLSALRLALLNSFSLNLPVPWQPHVHTSSNTFRQSSIASTFIAYGIQYPCLSLLTIPACFNILRCCDTAGGVKPRFSEISFTPKGPFVLRSSMIFTRVSTLKTLNISAGSIIIE
jgi:hypothetical protein